MAIGNRVYVQKHYSNIIERAQAHYDELAAVWPYNASWTGRIHGNPAYSYINIPLETHHSQNQVAWHGIRLYRNGSWRPMSFSGRGHISRRDLVRIIGEI